MKIRKAVNFANSIGLEIHAGHGLTYQSAKILSKLLLVLLPLTSLFHIPLMIPNSFLTFG